MLNKLAFNLVESKKKKNIRNSHMNFLGKLHANDRQLYGNKTRGLWQPESIILSTSYLKAISSSNYRMVSKLNAL